MDNQPYIGITGFTRTRDVVMASMWFDTLPHAHNVDRQLMVGILISRKTMVSRLSAPYPERYANVDMMAELCQVAAFEKDVLPVLHVCGLNQQNMPSTDVLHTLVQMRIYGGHHCKGIQINGGPMPSWVLTKYRSCFPDDIIIQQLPKACLQGHPVDIARQLDGWSDLINHVLIDASGGEGIPLDATRAKEIIIALGTRFPALGIGVAGGLGPYTVDLLKPLLAEFPLLSFDAESQLMNDNGLNYPSVRGYLADAANLLKRDIGRVCDGCGKRALCHDIQGGAVCDQCLEIANMKG